jgi:hypothetical protein
LEQRYTEAKRSVLKSNWGSLIIQGLCSSSLVEAEAVLVVERGAAAIETAASILDDSAVHQDRRDFCGQRQMTSFAIQYSTLLI